MARMPPNLWQQRLPESRGSESPLRGLEPRKCVLRLSNRQPRESHRGIRRYPESNSKVRNGLGRYHDELCMFPRESSCGPKSPSPKVESDRSSSRETQEDLTAEERQIVEKSLPEDELRNSCSISGVARIVGRSKSRYSEIHLSSHPRGTTTGRLLTRLSRALNMGDVR